MTGTYERLAQLLADRYTVEREVGSGGMATVLLATDIRHARRVAIKVLRADVAQRTGADRFLREIRTTANLQHPHIVPLFDSGEAAGTVYYVMPYVEGETLRDRLEREGPLPVADAVRIAREVADALDYAHRHGVVHRDVKPENVLLHDGRAMVADFGIALALARTTGDVRLTETGMSVGTPQYMSPEQAMGEKHITARTDIFALGAILYEMLAGEPPFAGESAQLIVAKMMTAEPTPIVTLRPSVPAHVATAIDGALQRVAADRYATASAFAEALQPPNVIATASTRATLSTPRPTTRWWMLAGVAVAIAAAAGYLVHGPATVPISMGRVARAEIALEQNQLLSINAFPIAISRDGARIVYAGDDSGKVRLFVRALADTVSHVLPGTDGATSPFFSPDGAWIGFFAGGKLKKVPRSGGAPFDIAEASAGENGADWGMDGTILYALGDGSLHRARAEGGAPPEDVLIRMDKDQRATLGLLKWPSFLPGSRQALVSTDSGISVIDLTTGDIRTVTRGRQARYLSSGQLLLGDESGRMRVVGFDAKRAEISGTFLPTFEALRGPARGPAYVTVSENGTLVYVPGGFQRTLVRVDRYGRETPINVEPRGYRFPSISPDGRRIAVTVDPRPSAIWLIDPALGQATPLTSGNMHAVLPTWSWDGTRIAFTSFINFPSPPGTGAWIFVQQGAERHIAFQPTTAQRDVDFSPRIWTRSDELIGNVHGTRPGQEFSDVARVQLGDSIITPLVESPADEQEPALSADGRWLAYSSDISGANEVYVRPYVGSGRAVLVSTRGGVEPHWTANGDELLYRSGTRIMSVAVRTRPDFSAVRAPQMLFSGPFDFSQSNNWSPSPDGSFFVFVKADPNLGRQLRIVFNWFDELKSSGGK